MSALLRCGLALLLAVGMLIAADQDPWGKDIPVQPWMGTGWPMRMRVCADYRAGIACRLPYQLLPRDQALATYSRVRPKTVYTPTGKAPDGRTKVRMGTTLEWETEPSLRLVSEAVAAPPADLAAIGDRLSEVAGLSWQPFDYYATAAHRPFAAKDWAPPGITALIGSGAGRQVLALHHGTHCSVVVIAGELSATTDLLERVEVMGADRKGVRMTWAEAQGAKGIALAADGTPAKAVKGPLPWAKGFGMETRHYHITSNTTPALLAIRARDLEALYDSYETFFETTDTAPLKFEVHITDTWDDFQALSTACDRPLEVAKGSVLGGFFVPMSQSLWVYEESGKLGGPSFSIEHVMCHECSHQFLHMACNGSDHVPTWVNEGVAVHFENGTLAGGRYRHRPPVDRIKRLASLYREERTTLQPMNKYLDHHGGIGADLYGEVYAMVHFWAYGTPGGKQRFHDYWKALRAGEDGLVAFERIFVTDMVRLTGSRQKALDNWREQLTTYVVRQLTKLKEP